MRAIHAALFLICIHITSCVSDNKKPDTQDSYFYNFKAFFNAEVEKLNKRNPAVEKTITHNDQSETKTLNIHNWKQELDLFYESDINKASWKNSYTADSSASKIIYTAKEDKLRIRKAEVYFSDKQQPVRISFHNKTANYLYSSEERLDYYPDSLYTIHKKQKVVLLGENDYHITGKFR